MKLGRLPNDPMKPRLTLTLAPGAVAPASSNWDTKVSHWPMYGNDTVGDCTCAAAGHMIQTWTANASSELDITDDQVLTAYEAVSGYNPATGANDNGAVMQSVLDYWRTTGIGDHKIVAFAQIQVTDINAIQVAIAEFGEVYLGINFPAFAMDQFNAGQPWDVSDVNTTIEGGHAICSGAYDNATGSWEVITWGKAQQMTHAFFEKYVEEAWVAVTQDWIDKNGQAPTGVDTSALGAQYVALTGQANPFPGPVPQPTPTPPPSPVPTPGPAPDVVAEDLRVALERGLEHRRSLPRYLVEAAKAWLARF